MDVLELNQFKYYLQPRPREFNKGKAGHILLVGGNLGFSGSMRLGGEAALRVGAGLVSIATHPLHATTLNMNCPELMCWGISKPQDLNKLITKTNIIVIGPGLGQTEWSKSLLNYIFSTDKPLIVDADGLNLLSKQPIKKNNWILTPHPGEAARLLNTEIKNIQQDRALALNNLQNKFGGIVVLKGAHTLIYDGDKITMCTAGNPGMSTAGMGDVLCGVIGGLAAQGLPLIEAAKFGVLIHAMAGDRAALQGEKGMIASDLMPHLRSLVNEL